MKQRDKAFEALRRTNPVVDDEIPGADSPDARKLLARVLETPRDHERSFVASHRRLRLAVAIAAISLMTVAATWIWIRSISIPNAISCHEAVDLTSDIAAAPAGGAATAEACAPVWESQTLVNPEVAPTGSVPPLTACVAENGALAVFPTDDNSICDRLGLAHPDPATQESADNIRDLENQLIDYFQSTDCVPINQATDHVSNLAAEHGLSDWAIEAQNETPERPCASFSIDPDLETIFIIPIPQP